MAFKQRLLQAQPLARQLVRINPSHWLAKDILFAHTGWQGFVFGAPADPLLPDLLPKRQSNLTGTIDNSPFAASNNWSGDGTNFLEYLTGGHSVVLTLSVWGCRTGNITNTANAISFASGSSDAGALYLRTGTSPYAAQLLSITSAGTSTVASSSTNTTTNTWQHFSGWRASTTSRAVYLNGASKGTSTASNSIGSHDRFLVAAARRSGSNPIATSELAGLAFPLAIGRVLDDGEVERLYAEQNDNPWSLFAERPIWVPVSSGGGYTHPTLSNARMGSLTSTTGVPLVDYSF